MHRKRFQVLDRQRDKMRQETIETLKGKQLICDQIFAICCDTTSSNTGVHNGAVQILSTTLNAQILWLMSRHHIYEVYISHFMKALTGQKTKGPRRQLYVRLQKVWPDVAKSIQAAAPGNKLCLFDWNGVQVGSELHSMALEALQFGQRALELNTFARSDYKKGL